jgi:hypothetical protein
MTTQNICLQAASEMRPEGITPPILHNTLNVSKLHVLTYRWTLVVLLMLLTTASAWAWTGSGTSSDPYQITSKSDLETLRDNVNGGQNYNNVYFRQTTPITLSGNWTPIGTTESTPFKGHYDGGNFAITGLQVTGSYQYAGLFGVIASGDYVPQQGYYRQAELKNINIVECNINVGDVFNGKAGGIAGQASTIDMSGCRVSGTITGNKEVCGLIGHMAASAGIKVTDCFVDVSVTGTSENSPIVFLMLTITTTASGNYCHDRIGNVAAGITATSLYMVKGIPSGVTVAETNATLTFNATPYFAAGATATLTVDDANQAFKAFSVTGATGYNVAADKKSATVTLATSDASVSATLQTVGGSCGTSATWALTQDGSGNYTRLTISGNGAMQDYGYTTVGDLWRTTAPWGYGLTSVTVGDGVTAIGSYAFIGCQSLATATIGSSVATIGQQALDHCDGITQITLPASVTTLGQGAFYNCIGLQRIDILHDGEVSLAANVFHNDNALQYIVFSSIAALQANTTGNWSAHADKLRAKFGNQHFAVTTEGGTPAYQIATADDLRNLAAAVNDTGNYASTGKTFRQTADIDLASGGNFTPIGSRGSDESFYGTYDGGGHTISGLTVSKEYGNIGLFGVVKGATVRNVILLSPNVNATTTSNSVSLGALIGTCDSGSSNLVENCHVVNPTVSSSSTSSKNYVGAIIGNIWGGNTTVTNCYYYGGNANAAYGYNENGATVTRVCPAHRVTPADGVTIQTPMTADLGFTCDADNNGTPENYWRTGAQLTLNYTGTVPDGYTIGYTATNGGTISGSTLTMPDADVTASANIIVIPWDGDGSEGNPYLIQYPSQLDLLAHRVNGTHGETRQTDGYSGKYFKLNNDISYTHKADGEAGAATESNYEAIGGYYGGNRYFSGHFDGNNKTISGIRIYKDGTGSTNSYQGIFGRTGDGAVIHDLTLVDARITGYDNTGGIVGSNDGTVTRCHVAADVEVCAVQSGAWYHGGIVGNNWGTGTIQQCTSAATLTTASATSTQYYGGIAGSNGGILSDNLAIGATVPAAAYNYYGAITGYNDGTLQRNYYAACKVADTENATGVGCGYIDDGNGGRFVADVTTDNGAVSIHTLTLAEGITTTTPVTVSIGSTGYYAQGTNIALSYSGDVPEGYQYSGFTASAGTISGSTLTMPAADVTVSLALTVLPWNGDGSEGSPYIIEYASQLDLLAHRVNGTHGETTNNYYNTYFKLNNDISYTHTSAWNDFTSDENNFEAIGDYGGTNRYFSGHFNGNNKTISGIRIYKGGSNIADMYQGIFGWTDYGADIHDLTLADARITGYDYTGGIVGYNIGGTVTRCHVADDVAVCAVKSNAYFHGGIVGNNDGGTIEQCTSAATLTTASATSTQYYGGIAGTNNGTVENCLYLGTTLNGNKNVGAIAGSNNGTVENCYFTSTAIQGKNKDGVILDNANSAVGNNDGTVTGCGLALQDNADNSKFLTLMAARNTALTYVSRTEPLSTAVDITLNGRTLFKDGKWNTLCLPFALSAEQIAAHADFAGATLMELDTDGTNGFDTTSGTLYLSFKTATAIEAGVPYIVKWAKAADYDSNASAYDFTSPTFSGVTIDATASTTVSDADGLLEEVQMVGCYSPVSVTANDKSILFLGDANTLYYSSIDNDIRSCRAYFSVPYIKGNPSATARAFRLDFGDGEQTGIMTVQGEGYTVNGADAWYTLDGRKLDGKPATKGLYINGGKKVVIK